MAFGSIGLEDRSIKELGGLRRCVILKERACIVLLLDDYWLLAVLTSGCKNSLKTVTSIPNQSTVAFNFPFP
jgi:hypothetical protein